jgi:hypothetical protein
MRVKHATVIEKEQLMLSTTFDVSNVRVLQRAELRGRNSTAKRSVMERDLRDRFAYGCFAKAAYRTFNLW